MTAIRKTPTPTNGGLDDGNDFATAIDTEIEALWKCAPTWLTSVSGANSITASSDAALVGPIVSYARPMAFWLVPVADNTTGVQINIDGVGLVDIRDKDGNALQGGALKNGRPTLIVNDGTRFRAILTSLSSDFPSSVPDMILREEQTTNVSAGTFSSGSFVTRNLNTVVRNVLAGASLASNLFTLQPGTYLIQWSAPAVACGLHQTRLFNVTDSTVVETGTSNVSNNAAVYVASESHGIAVAILTSAKQFRVEHKCQATEATVGLGVATNLGAKEVYSWVNVWKSGSLVAPGGLASFNNVLGGDVNLNNAGLYFDGPSVAQGSTGTWFASGTVTVEDTAGAALIQVKLWDGTNVVATTSQQVNAANVPFSISLSGLLPNPPGNIRLSVNSSSTTSKIKFSFTGFNHDSTITAVQIA